jgi:predicted N-acetyltransferase YhbS
MIRPAYIRNARPSDIPPCAAVELSAATSFAGTHMDIPAAYGVSDRADLAAAAARGLMWVADWQGEVAGFLFGEVTASGLYLREMSVAAHAQRHGLGRGLMLAGIAAGRELGVPLVSLTTDRTLVWNAPFYARLGFAIVEGADIPPDVQARLAGQAAAGFDPAQRCAMILRLGEPA